jgi:medium-chain acyl-[acyl-carrier-protein] hydrolase
MSPLQPVGTWITRPRPVPGAALRLFCFPFAGGGASVYRAWTASLAPAVEVCLVQPPGREERYSEPAFTDLVTLAGAVAREMAASWLDGRYAFFGHSMGALVAFETARALRRGDAPPPAALFVSSYVAPQAAEGRRPIHDLPDAAFVDEVRRLRGTPEAVLKSDELMAFVLPILRADFRACDTYRYSAEAPLRCPIVAYGGCDDEHVSADQLDQWRTQTAADFDRLELPGNHFFLQSHRDQLLSDLARRVASLAEAERAH